MASISRDFARNLIAVRADRGLSQNALERLAGISEGQVSRIEGGERGKSISLDSAFRLARALGLTIEALITGHGLVLSSASVVPAAPRARPRARAGGKPQRARPRAKPKR